MPLKDPSRPTIHKVEPFTNWSQAVAVLMDILDDLNSPDVEDHMTRFRLHLMLRRAFITQPTRAKTAWNDQPPPQCMEHPDAT